MWWLEIVGPFAAFMPWRAAWWRIAVVGAFWMHLITPFLARASKGGILVVPQIKAELEAALGRGMALSTVYKLLHRHGWRKLAPDKQHPQSDPVAQAAGKKNSPKRSPD